MRPLLPVLLLAGCLHPTTAQYNLLSRAEFSPAERDAVWTRALVELHRIAKLESSDGVVRIATTEVRTMPLQCRKRWCEATGQLQVIVAPGGMVSARYDRLLSGEVDMTYEGSYETLLADEEVAALQGELDAWVAGVVSPPGKP